MEFQFLTALNEFLVQVLASCRIDPRFATVTDVPLTRSHDFQGLVTLFEEVRLTHRLLRFTAHFAACLEARYQGLASREGRLPRKLSEGLATLIGGDPLGGFGLQTTILAQNGAQRKVQVAPPIDIGRVAESTAHGDTGALVHLRLGVGKNRDLNTENGGGNCGAKQRLVALVVGVSNQGHARGKKLGTSRFNADINTVLNWRTGCSSLSSARGVGDVEGEAVVEARVFAALKLGLSNRGLEGDIPQTRSLSLVGLAALEITQECCLGDLAGTSTDGLVVLSPVNRQAQVTPQIFEVLLIFNGQALAQFHKITT